MAKQPFIDYLLAPGADQVPLDAALRLRMTNVIADTWDEEWDVEAVYERGDVVSYNLALWVLNAATVPAGSIPGAPNWKRLIDFNDAYDLMIGEVTALLSDAVAQGNVPTYHNRDLAATFDLSSFTDVEIRRRSATSRLSPARYSKVAQPANVEPTHTGKFQSADGAWWELTCNDGRTRPEVFGAMGDGVANDHPATQEAVNYLWAKYAGGVVDFGAAIYLFDSSLRVDGKSNIGFKGLPGHKSVLKASASLNGSHNWDKNDIIFAANYPSGGVINARQSNIWAEDLVFDGSLQSADAVPVAPAGGYSLAGFECSRVDYPRVERCRFIKCYGNGVVFSSGAVSTLYAEDGVTRNGVEQGIVKDCEFIEVCRGVLPNYASAAAPMGTNGAAIQIGAGFSAQVTGNFCYKLGGSFLECFSNDGLVCAGNSCYGTPTTKVGAHPTTDLIYQKGLSTIKSDFALFNSSIVNNIFVDCGGFDLFGYMGENFFNNNTPSQGPNNCVIANNVLLRPTGSHSLGAVAIKPSGSGEVYTAAAIQTAALGYDSNQSMRIALVGGTGLSVVRQRGTDGAWMGVTLGPSQSFLLAHGDSFYLVYATPPTLIGAVLMPNVFKSGMTITGGTAINKSAEVTISIASPGVITWPAHGLAVNAVVRFTTTGALPTGLATGTTYYVKTVLDADTFTVSATQGGAVIDTTGTQSGVHTAHYYITGNARRTVIKDNCIVNPGQHGISMTDFRDGTVEGNFIENPGISTASAAFYLSMSFDQTGAGSYDSLFKSNKVFDTRSVSFTARVFHEVGSRTLNNRYDGNRFPLVTAEPITIAATPTSAGGSSAAGNYGPGALSAVLAAPAVPATNVELHNPFPYDCMVYVSGGTVTAINTGPPSATVATGMTSGGVYVRAGERIRLTYSVAPTWVWRPIN